MSEWGTISFICDLSTGPAVISALSSSGIAENAHVSFLILLSDISARTCCYESDATKTGVEVSENVIKEEDTCLQL